MKYLETNLTRILKVVNLLVDMQDDIAYEIIKRFFHLCYSELALLQIIILIITTTLLLHTLEES